MNQQSLIKLLVATAIVVGLAFWVSAGHSPESSGETSGGPLVPAMKADINDVSRIRIIGAGELPLVTIDRSDTRWTVAERGGYPADIEKVREYLLRLADARLIEAKTSTESLYAKLGVEDVKAPEAKGARVEIDGLKKPVKLIVGVFNGQGAGGTFVRRNDEKQSWLANGTLTPEKQPGNWLQKALVDIPSSRIQRIEITQGGKTLVARKDTAADANYQIDDVPKGRELNSAFEGNGIAAALAGMRFDDVRKAEELPVDAEHATVSARYLAFDGLIVNAFSRVDSGKTWVALSAIFDPVRAEANVLVEQAQAKLDFEAATTAWKEAVATAKTAPAEGKPTPAIPQEPLPPLAVSDPAKDKIERMQKIEREVAELNARFRGWLFELPPYTYSNMSRRIQDLLAPEKVES